MPVQSVVYKKAFSLARTACTALVPDIVNTIQMKAVFVEMFPKRFQVDGLAILRFIDVIEFYIDDGESIKNFILILKRELFAANFLIYFFKFHAIQRIVQYIFKQPKIGFAFTFRHFVPYANAVFLFLFINIRRFN